MKNTQNLKWAIKLFVTKKIKYQLRLLGIQDFKCTLKMVKCILFSFPYLNTASCWHKLAAISCCSLPSAKTLTMYHMPSLPLIEEKITNRHWKYLTAHAHSQPQEASWTYCETTLMSLKTRSNYFQVYRIVHSPLKNSTIKLSWPKGLLHSWRNIA